MLPGLDGTMASFQGGGGGSLAATVAPASVSKTGSTTGANKTVTSPAAVVTATGGAGGYTYAWVRTSGSALITATSPAAASTTFSALLTPDDSVAAVFTCTITDAAGAHVAVVVNVTLALVFTDIGGSL